ncbi:hypothetical protein MLD38_040273 [Melastoma candidum]|uniref:Uncharacterized protein n=1 Tax=Melastoma candidum TaxID=119954 RepID=A0ACB9L5W7_9MYRT|nr:hypothetical protein MLD38_040273 [Melastoma candidum]
MSESTGFAALAVYVTENIIPNKRMDEQQRRAEDSEGRTRGASLPLPSGAGGMKGKGWVLGGCPKLAPQFDGLNSFETFISS